MEDDRLEKRLAVGCLLAIAALWLLLPLFSPAGEPAPDASSGTPLISQR